MKIGLYNWNRLFSVRYVLELKKELSISPHRR